MIEDKIFEILDNANGYVGFDDNAKKATLQKIETEWERLPNEKYTCSDNALIAMMMIDEYLKFNMPDEAEKWADILYKNDRGDSGEEEFTRGKIHFEKEEFERAKQLFLIAMRKSEGRHFVNAPKKYVDLLKKN